jgi:hypothetical protein
MEFSRLSLQDQGGVLTKSGGLEPMTPNEFAVACAILEDWRKLIAAGKAQRWDVIKWAVTHAR